MSAPTLNRLAVLLAAREADTVLRLEDLDDALADELARRSAQAREAGWDNDTLAAMTEKALRSDRHPTAIARRAAFLHHLDRLTDGARKRTHPASSPQAA